ncbi:MAG: methyltransferase domain-containing protein [Chloroflexota bacterium]
MILPRETVPVAAVAAHYDELDRFYREIWGEHVHHGLWRTGRERPEEAVVQLVELVAQHAGIAPHARVCDVGAGYGATARHLARRYDAHVTALTISIVQCAYARSLDPAADNPVYLLRDWLANGLPDESFDAVIMIESTEHMADKRRAFDEARRVLRPGGRLVVCAWLAREEARPWEVRHLLEPICREGRLAGMGTQSEYAELIAAAGLARESFEDLSAQVRRTWPICIGRALRGLWRHPHYRAFLRDRSRPNRVFLWAMPRLWAAYLTGSMRYGLFAARRSQ